MVERLSCAKPRSSRRESPGQFFGGHFAGSARILRCEGFMRVLFLYNMAVVWVFILCSVRSRVPKP